MRGSLRLRLLIGIAVIATVVFTASALTTYGLLRRSLIAEFDALLGAKIRSLATLIEQTTSGVEIEFHEHPMQEYARKVRPEYYQVWTQDEQVLARSRRLGLADLQPLGGSLNAPVVRAVTLPDGRQGRQASATFFPALEEEMHELRQRPQSLAHDDEEDDEDDHAGIVGPADRQALTIAVARETAVIDEALAQLRAMLLVVAGVAVVCLLVTLGWLVDVSLRPLRDLSSQIALVDERALGFRFDPDPAPRELTPIIGHLNDLIQRLERAFERERTFSADIAHELRTPLAGIGSTLEVAMLRPRTGDEYREALADCHRICVGMQQVVTALLSLANIETGTASIVKRPTNVDRLIRECWSEFETIATHRDVVIRQSGATDLLLATDADQLRVVLNNLFANATEYVNAGGEIEIAWRNSAGRAVISISNTGCEFDQTVAERCFDRFWQADTARRNTGSHAGLGLALCQKIVHLLGGGIHVDVDHERFNVTIELRLDCGAPSPGKGDQNTTSSETDALAELLLSDEARAGGQALPH